MHDFGLVALCQAYAIFINGLANFRLSIGYERNFFTSSDDRQKGALLYSVILFVDVYLTEKSSKETTKTALKWAHIAISNAKRAFLGIYHKIKAKFLQVYMDEFITSSIEDILAKISSRGLQYHFQALSCNLADEQINFKL